MCDDIFQRRERMITPPTAAAAMAKLTGLPSNRVTLSTADLNASAAMAAVPSCEPVLIKSPSRPPPPPLPPFDDLDPLRNVGKSDTPAAAPTAPRRLPEPPPDGFSSGFAVPGGFVFDGLGTVLPEAVGLLATVGFGAAGEGVGGTGFHPTCERFLGGADEIGERIPLLGIFLLVGYFFLRPGYNNVWRTFKQ